MTGTGMMLRTAGEREADVACPHCRIRIQRGESVAVCETCGSVHHHQCWRDHAGCGAYSCVGNGRAPSGSALTITAEEIHNATPLPSRPVTTYAPAGYAPIRSEPARPRSLDPLAVVAFALALLAGAAALSAWQGDLAPKTLRLVALAGGIGGLLAVLLGAASLGSMNRGRSKGILLGTTGLLGGLASIVAVILVFVSNVNEPVAAGIGFEDLQAPDPADLVGMDPAIERGMRANVLIHAGLGVIGSGVIVDIANGRATIITNRHVVDQEYQTDPRDPPPGRAAELEPDVLLIGQGMEEGKVVWLAPDGIDLAVLRVPCHSQEPRAVKWDPTRRAKIGEDVFAIGNPQGLGWSHTKGAVSRYRPRWIGGRQVRVIQTEAAINQGNSGGGLYDQEGFLLGINTWTQDKRISEGLNFALSLESVADLLPADLVPRAEKKP